MRLVDHLLPDPLRSLGPRVVVIWAFVNLGMILAVGILLWAIGDDPDLLLIIGYLLAYGLFWILFAKGWKPPYSSGGFFLAVLVLALGEETLAYAVGGGLSGEARSLWHTWAVAVPSFMAIGLMSWGARRYGGLSDRAAFFWLGGLGVCIEWLLGGAGNPIVLVFFGGTTLWLYGTMVALPLKGERPEHPWWRGVLVLIGFFVVGAALAILIGPILLEPLVTG